MVMHVITTLIVFLFIDQIHAFSVTGKITFDGGKPSSFPNGSWVTVKIEDTSLADASAIKLGKQRFEIKDYDSSKPLKYNIENIKNPEVPHITISISAVINVGWVPISNAPNAEWIRTGDYLTTTNTNVPYAEGKDNYDIDVPVVKYE